MIEQDVRFCHSERSSARAGLPGSRTPKPELHLGTGGRDGGSYEPDQVLEETVTLAKAIRQDRASRMLQCQGGGFEQPMTTELFTTLFVR
eukprot:CAMPEP_0172387306 /NCGR_PEP_ID=MMETSP1061-20121228/4628_1 /TAXON_ID=37318 /ORGANISM="Pseudo-nitzschia pungens, Strain cf. pungens" /LENGTH=89 /DNA_ID=CAMNT_0013116897 /DNA_START=110 /DNA_END=379 /DNA_ORIENTATION=-